LARSPTCGRRPTSVRGAHRELRRGEEEPDRQGDQGEPPLLSRDATIGRNVNVGAGTITCNYDGIHKHPTVLGDGVFVGSDTMLVAPVTVGKGALIGAGSTITKNVPPYALALCRAEEKVIEGGLPASAGASQKSGLTVPAAKKGKK